MHYNVHQPRAFHNRIARYLGVLVATALVATLGLPSAVQAQTTGAPKVTYVDNTDAFTVLKPHGPIDEDPYWVLEVDGPVSVPDMVMMDDATNFDTEGFTVQAKGNDGDWAFRLASGTAVAGAANEGTAGGTDIVASEIEERNTGPWLSYMHGKPDAPDGFAYAMSGTTHLFTWENAIPRKPNVGVISYWLRWTSGDSTLAATKWTAHKDAITEDFYRLSSTQAKALKDGETYTFELTALGTSSSTTKVLTSAAATTMVQIGTGAVVVEEDGEEPVPTPTLPEIAALLLAMLLLGSGAYLLRGRQSGGLSQA